MNFEELISEIIKTQSFKDCLKTHLAEALAAKTIDRTYDELVEEIRPILIEEYKKIAYEFLKEYMQVEIDLKHSVKEILKGFTKEEIITMLSGKND